MVNPINLQVVGKLHMLGLQKKLGMLLDEKNNRSIY
jgi:hypothetical protein